MKITSPYNFVPINSHVFYPDWADLASQDLPFEDGKDVVINVKLENVSPLFTRDGEIKELSSHIIGEGGERHYFIPATTIKGMLREIVEIMTFGKMQEGKDYQNRYFGYRDVARQTGTKQNADYMNKVSRGKPGWLSKDGEHYFFTPCLASLEKIKTDEVLELFPSYKSDPSIWKSNVSVEKDDIYPAYPEIEKDGDYYRIVCTGKMNDKKYELLFPSAEVEPLKLDEETVQAFFTMYESTPGFAAAKDGDGCFRSALEKGRRIPVFLLELECGKTTLGLSRMFKLPFKYNVRQQVEVLQASDPTRRDFAETLFGYASKDDSLKGRVQVSHAFMEGFVDDSELKENRRVLGSPKASFYPLYLKQKQSPYKTYDDRGGIAGRKLYRIHAGGTTSAQTQGENQNVGTTFKALPEGHTFRFRITLHNVKEVEVGAVLSALTLNGTQDVYWNLGMAKAFGFGKCRIKLDSREIHGLERNAEYYMHKFQMMMSVFTCEHMPQILWENTESVTQLVNILSEHKEEDVRMMNLDEYGECKYEKRNPFNTLQEKGNPIHSWLSDEDKGKARELAFNARNECAEREARQSLSALYAQARECLGSGNYTGAKKIYNGIIDELLKKGIAVLEEKQLLSEVEDKIAQQEQETRRQAAEEAARAQQERLSAGLAAMLDRLAGDGVSYSVKEFKVCFQKVEKWLKDSHAEKLSETDAVALYATAGRLLKEPSKKDEREIAKSFETGGVWKKLTAYLGCDKAKTLYDSYTQ